MHSPVNQVAAEEKLAAFRLLDPFGQWQSLENQRCCRLCRRIFAGHEVEIIGARLQCPTPECNSAPADWASAPDSNDSVVAEADEFSFLFQQGGA